MHAGHRIHVERRTGWWPMSDPAHYECEIGSEGHATIAAELTRVLAPRLLPVYETSPYTVAVAREFAAEAERAPHDATWHIEVRSADTRSGRPSLVSLNRSDVAVKAVRS